MGRLALGRAVLFPGLSKAGGFGVLAGTSMEKSE